MINRIFLIYLVVLSLGFGKESFSQSIDSLQFMLRTEIPDTLKAKTYMQLAGMLVRRDPDLATKYIDSTEMIPSYLNIPTKKMRVAFLRGAIEERRQNFDKAKEYFNLLIEQEGTNEVDATLLGQTHYKLGNMARQQNNLEETVKHINEAKDFFAQVGDSTRIADSDIILGIIYKNSQQYEKAIEYYQSSYDHYVSIGDYDNMATCVLNIANVLGRQMKHEEALVLYDEAYELAQRLDRNEGLLAFIYGNKANAFTSLNRYEEAHENALKAYEIRKDRARPREKTNSLLGLAVNLKALGRYNESRRRINEALEIAESNDGMLEAKQRLYKLLFQIERDLGNASRALKAVDTYTTLNDSLRNLELDKKVLELNEKFETERKEKEIALLNADKELAATKLTAARRQTYGLLGGLLLISGLLFSVFRLYRKTQSQNAIISKALGEKEILLKEIHHRVKNNLQFISSLLGLQSEHVEDKAALGALEEGQNRVQSMALIHQNLYQEDNLTGVDMKQYFIKLTRGLFDSYNIRKDQIQLDMNIENINLDVDTVIPIGLIVNELVSNSLKYAFPDDRKGLINVALKEEDKKLVLSVKDNGIGMTDEQKESLGKSFGYRLVNVFKDQLRAELTIQGDNGTNVTMEIAKYDKT